jgi:hypothetical protein
MHEKASKGDAVFHAPPIVVVGNAKCGGLLASVILQRDYRGQDTSRQYK